MSIVKSLGSLMGIVAFGGVMAFSMSGWVKGKVFSLMWDQQSTLDCGGSFVMTIEGKTIDMGGNAFMAGGDCELNIIDSDITADTVVSGGGNAKIKIEGGRIEGRNAAIDIGGNAVVDIEGAEIVGAIERGGSARVNGLEGDPRVADQVEGVEQGDEQAYEAAICAELVQPCYEKHEAWGNISGVVTADIDADGTVEDASYEGDAPDEVQQCLLDTARKRSIDGYDGDPIRIACQYSGSLTKGTQMLATDWTVQPRGA